MSVPVNNGSALGEEERPVPEAPGAPKHHRRATLLMLAGGLLLLGAGLLFALTSPLATRPPPSPSPLPAEFTPPPSLAELVQQYPKLAPLLTDPELDSAYKQFLIAYQEGGKEAAVDLARRRGLLNDRDEIRVTLFLDTDDPAPLVAQLQGVGIRVVAAYRDQVEIAIPLALIEATAESENPGAIFGQLTALEHVIAVRVPALHTSQGSRIPGEGIRVVGADRWHEAGFTGAGIRIGVLDLGFGGYPDLLGRELPDTVVVEHFGDWDPDEVHGTACAEIIHELAPDAELFFAWYDGSDAAEGEAVDWLLSQGVHIISHSAGALIGPRDGTGWQARLVDSVAAWGVLWANSSGNEAQSHYRALFTDTDGDDVHEFAPRQERMRLLPYLPFIKVFLMWEDEWGHARRDYELYLTDGAGNVLASSESPQDGREGADPVEGIIYSQLTDESLYVAVKAYRVDRPVTLDIFVNGADVAYPSPEYSLAIPADAVGALAVGAAYWQRDALADYSSRGPTTDGRLKPELSAPTGVSTASYGDEPFGGTSASAPHVAGAAALVWQAYPEFTRQQVVDFLLAHAIDRGPQGPDTGYGYGRLQLPPPPSPTTAGPPSPSPAGPTPPPVEGGPPPPLPTPTPVPFVTPPLPSAPSGGVGAGTLILLVGAMGFLGMGLLLVGATVWMLSRRTPAPSPARPAPHGRPPSYPAPPLPPPSYPPPPPAPPPAAETGPFLPPTESWAPPTFPSYPAPPGTASCPSCGASLRPGARFCPRCGQPVSAAPARCPSCGASLRPGARFCPGCGQPVSAAPARCPSCGASLRPGARFCPRCGQPVH